jgi:hypothetical protein
MLRALEQTQMSYHNVQAQVIAHALLGEAESRVFRCLADDRHAHAALAMTAIEEILHRSCSQRTAIGSPCASHRARLAEPRRFFEGFNQPAALMNELPQLGHVARCG